MAQTQRRCLIVSPGPGTRGGGVEMHVGLVGDALRGAGWQVAETGPTLGGPGRWRWDERTGLRALRTTRSAVRGIRPGAADLVISNGTLGASCPPGLPRIHVYHGTMVEHVRLGEPDLPRRERVRHGASSGLVEALAGVGATRVAVLQAVAEEVRRHYRLEVDHVIPLGIDPSAFAPRPQAEARRRLGLPLEARLALTVGRQEVRKGSDLVGEVCRRAGYTLVVAGSPAPEEGIHLGQLGHDVLPWAYAAADVVLFPSRYEGFGYVTLEALASHAAVVTTRTGWAPELAAKVPGYGPFVVEPTVDALVAALRRVTAGTPPVPRAEAAALVAREHTLRQFGARWVALAEQVSAAR